MLSMYIPGVGFDHKNTVRMWLGIVILAICIVWGCLYSINVLYYSIGVGLIIIAIFLISNKLRIIKLRKYKKNGGGILKNIRVTGIKILSKKYWDEYYVELKDENITYYSETYQEGRIGGISVGFMSNIYKKYGFEFDEKETYKQEVLAECNRCIEEKKYELENEGFLKKFISNMQIMSMKGQRDTVEKGYEPQYREVNGHRITVGDMLDVYFDPKNTKYYRVDIDFLFEKEAK